MDPARQRQAEIECTLRSDALLRVAGIVLLCLGLAAASIIWYRYDPTVAREHGPMENFEVACLLAGMCILLWRIRTLNTRAERIFYGALALFFATFVVLEVDLRESGIRPLVKIMNGRIRDLWLGSLWLAALLLFVINARSVWPIFLQWLHSRSGKLMISAGVLWMASAVVDKAWIVQKDLFLEELFEVPATSLMLLSVVRQPRCPDTSTAELPASDGGQSRNA